MKKIYMLMAAMLMFSFSFAQIQPKPFRSEKIAAGKPELKLQKSAKGEASEELFNYAEAVYVYMAQELDGSHYAAGRVAMDSNGLTTYSDSTTGYGFWFGLGQTFDFTNTIWDDVAPEQGISMNATNSYNIDSVFILGHYNGGSAVPAGNVDTLIVAIFTNFTDELMTLQAGNPAVPVVEYYPVPYDANTHLSQGAQIYKIPLTSADYGEVNAETGGMYPDYFGVPVHLNNITSKVINVTYTLKRAYEVPLNDNILNHTRFYGWVAEDPRPEYYPFAGSGVATPPDEIYHNHNQGTIISEYNLNQSSYDFFNNYFYPCPIWNQAINYPDITLRVSCNDCAIVNVPEIEKNNMTVYPNPATNKFTVDLGNDEKANIQLFNLVGQMVYNETITGRADVNVANLHSGVYMLKVNQNGKISTTKVVVK
ncbi:MAG: T9SS type A sorting domain-containing protein [Bacteroidales bacterium]|nr:T9SS type A sorting domain-containing protein [Bacteroidales bacterium]